MGKLTKSDGKSAFLTLKLKADNGYSSDETHRIDVDQWGDILMVCADKEARKKIAAAGDMFAALQSIAGNSCCDGCQEAARVARAALLKAEGVGSHGE